MAKMRAARLHEPGQPFHVDEIDRPEPRAGDLLVKVEACGIIPNMNAIVSGKYWHHLPPMPAVIGLDAAGVVVKAPIGRSDIGEGDRVYVNPFLNCGECYYCRSGAPMSCADAALRGSVSRRAERSCWKTTPMAAWPNISRLRPPMSLSYRGK